MLGFTITAPFIDAFAKLAGKEIPVFEISASRFLVQSLILFPLAISLNVFYKPDNKEVFFHFIRAFLILTATSFFILAVKFLPLADAISIFFVSPFILTILGNFILKEKIGFRRILACLIGFLGAILIIQPQYINFGYASTFPLITAICFSFYLLLTRTMTQKKNPITIQLYTSLTALVFIIPILYFMDGSNNIYFDPIIPNKYYLLLMLGVGVSATVSHLFLTFAFKLTEVSILAPLQYFEIVSATILGYLIFNDFPNGLTFTGIFLIVSAGLYIFLREKKIKTKIY